MELEEIFLREFQNSWLEGVVNVKIGNVRSGYTTANKGIPQGRILRPLLLISFIKIFAAGLSTSQFQLYADKTKYTPVLTTSCNDNFLRVLYQHFTTGSRHDN